MLAVGLKPHICPVVRLVWARKMPAGSSCCMEVELLMLLCWVPAQHTMLGRCSSGDDSLPRWIICFLLACHLLGISTTWHCGYPCHWRKKSSVEL